MSVVTSRRGKCPLVLCLFIAVVFWTWRQPRICIFNRCIADITSAAYAPGIHRFPGNVDLASPEAPFVTWPLARVCNETTWMPGLVFVCDNNSGGIGNIRSYILTCIRYSIAAGATGLILPRIEARSDKDLSSLFQGPRPFDYFFDEQHFRRGLADSCPQIIIYDKTEDIPNLKDTRTEDITPKGYGLRGGCHEKDINRHTDLFGPRLHAALATTAETFNLPAISPVNPHLVRLTWGVQWEFPAWKDGPEFANTFGGLLRFRPDILELGKTTTAAMRRFARSTSEGSEAQSFMGIHLRTESDALKFWPTYGVQSAGYLREASRRGFHAAYLATGNATEASKFAAKAAAQHQMRVFTKHELLKDSPKDLKKLDFMTWDQQALIDFVVLLYSDYFVGVSPSTFSISVAGKRHLAEDGLYTRPWRVGQEGNGRSWLVGNYNNYWEDWLFMFDSLWP